MAESLVHMILVEKMYSRIRDEIFSGDDGSILVDLPRTGKFNKPTRIDDFCPDIYAISIRNNFLIVGEAKTSEDIERRHSIEQYKSFLTHTIKYSADSLFIICVPIEFTARAKSVIRKVAIDNEITNAKYTVWGY